jgi:DNA polymerase
VAEMPIGVGSVEEVERLMSDPIPWAPGLPLKAVGFESPYYRKD